MSSHHIVRDDQEPAILIDTLESSSFEIILPLLEWSPIVIATEHTYEKLLSLDIKIDVIFWKENKGLILKNMERQNEFCALVNYSTELLKSVLIWLKDQGHYALNFFGNDFDNEIQNLQKQQDFINTLVVFKGRFKYVLSSKSPFEKWIPKGIEISVPSDIINYENLYESKEGLYQVMEDGMVKIEHNDVIIIGEKIIVQ